MTQGIRTWWANAFFITATILMWLSIIASVVVGVTIGVIAGGSGGSKGGGGNGGVVQTYTDPLGKSCNINDTHLDNYQDLLCP